MEHFDCRSRQNLALANGKNWLWQIEFFNLVVLKRYEKIAIMVLFADENLTTRGHFEYIFFEYEVLRDSTRNFDINNMLGKGVFSEVYKV